MRGELGLGISLSIAVGPLLVRVCALLVVLLFPRFLLSESYRVTLPATSFIMQDTAGLSGMMRGILSFRCNFLMNLF